MKYVHMIAFILVIVGGLNWLGVAFGYNVVEMLLGSDTPASMVTYILVGLSAVYLVLEHKKTCKHCDQMGK
jgi:uncharacterized protein